MRRLALSLFLALAACDSSPPEPGNAAGPAAAAPKAEAAPPTAAVPPSAPTTGDARLTATGWGPLRIGMSVAEVTAALGPDSDPEAIGGPDPQACDQFRPARAPSGMLVMIEDGRLTRISLIDDSPVKTDRAIGPGDTAEKVLAAYPGARIAPHKYVGPPAGYVTIWQSGGEGAVRNASARGIVYELGENGRVEAVHAGGPSIEYVEGCA